MRFQLGQVLFGVQFSYARDRLNPRIGMFGMPMMWDDDVPEKANFIKLVPTEHHKVYWEYDDKKKPAQHDGYLLKSEDGVVFANQYPTASFGQTSDTANRRFHRYFKEDSGESDAFFNAEEKGIYEYHLLTDVLEQIQDGIHKIRNMDPNSPHFKVAQNKKDLLSHYYNRLVREFTEAYPDYHISCTRKEIINGLGVFHEEALIYQCISPQQLCKMHPDEITAALKNDGRIEVKFAHGDKLSAAIVPVKGTTKEGYAYHVDMYEVTCESVKYLSRTKGGEAGREYFPLTQPEKAALCLSKRATAIHPSLGIGMGMDKEDIAVLDCATRAAEVRPEWVISQLDHHGMHKFEFLSGELLVLEKRNASAIPDKEEPFYTITYRTKEEDGKFDQHCATMPVLAESTAVLVYLKALKLPQPSDVICSGIMGKLMDEVVQECSAAFVADSDASKKS